MGNFNRLVEAKSVLGAQMMNCGVWSLERMKEERQQLKREMRIKRFAQAGETCARPTAARGHGKEGTKGKTL